MIDVSTVLESRHFPFRHAAVCDYHSGAPPEGCRQSKKRQQHCGSNKCRYDNIANIAMIPPVTTVGYLQQE